MRDAPLTVNRHHFQAQLNPAHKLIEISTPDPRAARPLHISSSQVGCGLTEVTTDTTGVTKHRIGCIGHIVVQIMLLLQNKCTGKHHDGHVLPSVCSVQRRHVDGPSPVRQVTDGSYTREKNLRQRGWKGQLSMRSSPSIQHPYQFIFILLAPF